MVNLEIPYDFKRMIDSVEFKESSKYIIKNTGFEFTKHQVGAFASGEIHTSVNIRTCGDMPLYMTDLLKRMAYGCNSAGMILEFYDDWITDIVYTGRWINAGEIVENSVMHGAATIELACWKQTEIV